MELALICLLIGAVIGTVLGYWLSTHIYSVAAAATSAVTRATTISGGDVAALNAKIDGMGNALQAVAAKVQAPAIAAVDAAANAAPKASA
jgi:ABC-type lipoprotein release transport system permease subunit